MADVQDLWAVEKDLKRLDLQVTDISERLNLLYDRIGAVSGATSSSTILTGTGGGASGYITAGPGLTGGGSLPGAVTISVNMGYAFTWTNDHLFDDGFGDSPSIGFVGGSNDDTITINLDDSGTPGWRILSPLIIDS